VSDSLDQEDYQIGGPGIVVELDESKFGKRKQHRGHHVEGVWVLGGVERTRERKLFMVTVADRSAETLELEILRHVLPGSIVVTDLWKGYSQLWAKFGFDHLTVNHSENFVDPETLACTNTIEGTWAGVKIAIPRRNRVRKDFEEHLFEYIWRRKNGLALWEGFVQALRDVVYTE